LAPFARLTYVDGTLEDDRADGKSPVIPRFFAATAAVRHTDAGVRLVIRVASAVLLLGLATPAAADAPLCAEDARTQTVETREGPIAPASMCPPPSEDAADAEVRALWERARITTDAEESVALLEALIQQTPRLEDWLGLKLGERLIEAGDPARAKEVFEQAIDSVDSEVTVRARIGRVHAMLEMGHRRAEEELRRLRFRYPELPYEPELELALGGMREAAEDIDGAAQVYRMLDMRSPGSAAAAEARARMDRMRAEGIDVRGLSPTQEVERAERLVRRGPLTEARRSVGVLLANEGLHATLRARVHFLAARMARHEGRFADARRHLALGRGADPEGGDPEEREAQQERAEDMAHAVLARERAAAEQRWRQLRAGRRLRAIGTARVMLMARVAARAGMTEELDGALSELVRRRLPPGLRWRAALDAMGPGDDTLILALLEGVDERSGQLGIGARYHQARTLQELERFPEAEAAYREVIERDRGVTPYYAMWSELQLDVLRREMVGSCGPEPFCAPGAEDADETEDAEAEAASDEITEVIEAALPAWDEVASKPSGAPNASLPEPTREDPPAAPEATSSEAPEPAAASTQRIELSAHEDPPPPREELHEGLAPSGTVREVPTPPAVDSLELAARLEPLAQRHAETFPWIGRAADMLRLGERQEAGRQLYEAFLAWREANGRAIRRTGFEAVARGAPRQRRFTSWPLRRERRALPDEDREELASVAEGVGEIGASTGFGGWDAVRERPRAHAELVEAAAARHGLDPNLLFAVMRVESIYQRHIVSYAGAIGLMQIMPRTGTLIAHARGEHDFTTADLLDPATNLEFAAWYLRSLLERFDGHLPLAIASYNGGPHNVRRWIQDHPSDMPLDVFLEHIPFDQTHRYVRRVLTHYRVYRAQQGLPMAELSTHLPPVRVDTEVAF